MAATGRRALDLSIHVQGVREVERALDALPADALVRLKARTKEIGRELAARIAAAGRADTRRQSVPAAARCLTQPDRLLGESSRAVVFVLGIVHRPHQSVTTRRRRASRCDL